MATVREKGNTYQIRVSAGYDSKGNQIIKSKTWKPSPTMTERQIKRNLKHKQYYLNNKYKTVNF